MTNLQEIISTKRLYGEIFGHRDSVDHVNYGKPKHRLIMETHQLPKGPAKKIAELLLDEPDGLTDIDICVMLGLDYSTFLDATDWLAWNGLIIIRARAGMRDASLRYRPRGDGKQRGSKWHSVA